MLLSTPQWGKGKTVFRWYSPHLLQRWRPTGGHHDLCGVTGLRPQHGGRKWRTRGQNGVCRHKFKFHVVPAPESHGGIWFPLVCSLRSTPCRRSLRYIVEGHILYRLVIRLEYFIDERLCFFAGTIERFTGGKGCKAGRIPQNCRKMSMKILEVG